MTAGELAMLVVTSEMTIAAVTLPGLGAAGTLRHVHSA